jgi:hypothetical protein
MKILVKKGAATERNLKSWTDRTIFDVHEILIVWIVMIGDFQSRGNFPSVHRHPSNVKSGWRVLR